MLRIVFLFLNETCFDPSLEPSRRGSSNEGPQHVFIKEIGKAFAKYPCYPFLQVALIFYVSVSAVMLLTAGLSLLSQTTVQGTTKILYHMVDTMFILAGMSLLLGMYCKLLFLCKERLLLATKNMAQLLALNELNQS